MSYNSGIISFMENIMLWFPIMAPNEFNDYNMNKCIRRGSQYTSLPI